MTYLISLDSSPWLYWTLCGIFYLWVTSLCFGVPDKVHAPGILAQVRPAWLGCDSTFFIALTVMLFAFRWPVFFFPYQFNPDESTFISCTLNLHHDPVFFRSTLGYHLNMYPRMLPGLLGLPQNFMTSRIMALLVVCGTLAVFHRTCRLFASSTAARLATLAPATFYALTTKGDFVHFSSEHIPILLLSGAIYYTLRIPEEKKRPSWIAYAAGLLLGAAPFAKNQATYFALVITLFCYAFILRRNELWREKLRTCFWLTLGGMTVPALIVCLSLMTGTLDRFWQGYVVMSLAYVGKSDSWLNRMSDIPEFLEIAQDFRGYFRAMLLTGFMGIVWLVYKRGWKDLPHTQRRLVIFSSIVLIMGIFTAFVTGRAYSHYLLFIVFPSAFWAFAMGVACLSTSHNQQIDSQKNNTPLAVIWCVVALVSQFADFALLPNNSKIRGRVREFVSVPKSEIGKEILRYGHSGEALGLWGWMYQYNVETGMRRAASDMLLEYLWVLPIQGRDLSNAKYLGLIPEFFRKLYIDDITRSNPPVFVDVVAPGSMAYTDRKLYGYETFTPLADFIKKNYQLVREINGTRIFVRNDRLAELNLSPNIFRVPSPQNLEDEILRNQKLVDATPNDLIAQTNLGIALEANRHFESALVHFQSAAEIQPNSDVILNHMGRVLLRMGRMESAKIYFEQILKANPSEPFALNRLAWILATSPNPLIRNGPVALQLASKANSTPEKLTPSSIQTLAAALAANGRYSEASMNAITAMNLASSLTDIPLADSIYKQLKYHICEEPFMDCSILESVQGAEGH